MLELLESAVHIYSVPGLFCTLVQSGLSIQISVWGGTDGEGQRSDGGGLARDSRQIREVKKIRLYKDWPRLVFQAFGRF